MKYWDLFREENEAVAGRHELAAERIGRIFDETSVSDVYRNYFIGTAEFIMLLEETYEKQKNGELAVMGLAELEKLNKALYRNVLPENYDESYANPAYASRILGVQYGPLLSFLYTEIRSGIVYAYESRLTDLTILEEIFIEVYNLFEEEEPKLEELKEALYYYVSDYCDVTLTYRIRETLDPSLDFALSIVMDSDLSDVRYLYRYGEYISDTEKEMSVFLASLPEEMICRMADTYTEGYRKGFAATGRSYENKKTVQLRYPIGFERMIRRAVENFRRMGLEPVLVRAAVGTMNRASSRTNGYYGTPANRQYEYDHRYDNAIYLDKAFKERKLSVLRVAYEEQRELAAGYAGPAVVETFGERTFKPINKSEAFSLSEKQEKLLLSYSSEAMGIIDSFIPGTETSFTIIAFPVPEIGPDFEDIFRETIRINTLDYELYRDIQQKIIDALDKADRVEIRGRDGNRTRLTVCLPPLRDPKKETNFENCVADVNIPVGEVFTSPLLAGTSGILHVGSVYIGEFQFRDLEIEFKDGKTVSCTCRNFDSEKECRDLVKQVILKNHEFLPMGEFAIGTNTTAYEVAGRYGILDKFPILIAEKMGPHFAVGDTCYSRMEDCPIYNPDGKEMKARENAFSVQRHENPQEAYFNCHTDITLPYSELDSIEAVGADGERTAIIANGRFALPGTEALNVPLDRMGKGGN